MKRRVVMRLINSLERQEKYLYFERYFAKYKKSLKLVGKLA